MPRNRLSNFPSVPTATWDEPGEGPEPWSGPSLGSLDRKAALVGVMLGWTFIRLVSNDMALYSTHVGSGDGDQGHVASNLVTLSPSAIIRLAGYTSELYAALVPNAGGSLARQRNYLYRLAHWLRDVANGAAVTHTMREQARDLDQALGQLIALFQGAEETADAREEEHFVAGADYEVEQIADTIRDSMILDPLGNHDIGG